MRFVTFIAVADMLGGPPLLPLPPPKSNDVGGDTSSTGETGPPAAMDAAVFLPKLSFHFEGFLVMGVGTGAVAGAGVVVEVEVDTEEGAGVGEIVEAGDLAEALRVLALLVLVSKGVGIAYIETGSNGLRARRLDVVVEVLLVDTDLCDEDLDLLISQASDCEATARVASVSSLGVVGDVGIGTTAPLPFRNPRLRRLFVEVDRDVIPSISIS